MFCLCTKNRIWIILEFLDHQMKMENVSLVEGICTDTCITQILSYPIELLSENILMGKTSKTRCRLTFAIDAMYLSAP